MLAVCGGMREKSQVLTMHRFLCLLLAAPLLALGLTPSERELMKQLGPDTPEPLPLWSGKPPQFLENAAPEVIKDNQTIQSVSVPTITSSMPRRSSIPWASP